MSLDDWVDWLEWIAVGLGLLPLAYGLLMRVTKGVRFLAPVREMLMMGTPLLESTDHELSVKAQARTVRGGPEDEARPMVQVTVELSSEYASLGLADYSAFDIFDRDIRESFGSPETGDATFDGHFILTVPLRSGVQALLADAELRTQLLEMSDALNNLWLHDSKLTYMESGTLSQEHFEMTLETLRGLFASTGLKPRIDLPSEH